MIIPICLTNVGKYNSNQFAPWTKIIMNHFPSIYNPTHGIFYSRALNEETYYSLEPVAYMSDDGYIKKVLLSNEAEEKVKSSMFSFVDENGKIDYSDMDIYSIDDGEFKYINFNTKVDFGMTYNYGDEIWFYSELYNANKYVKGISVKEELMSWSDGNLMAITFYNDEQVKKVAASMEILGVFHQPQRVRLIVNNEIVKETIVSKKEKIEFEFYKTDSPLIKVIVELPDAIAPSAIMKSDDTRVLGIAIQKMHFNKIE